MAQLGLGTETTLVIVAKSFSKNVDKYLGHLLKTYDLTYIDRLMRQRL